MYENSPSKFLYLLKLSILVESYLEKYNQNPYIKTIVEQTKYNLTNINDVVVYLNTISEIKNDEALVFDFYVKLLAYFVCKFTFDENDIKEILKNFHTKAIDMNYNPRINNADATANLTYNKIYDLASVNHNFLQKCEKIDKKIITAYKTILET